MYSLILTIKYYILYLHKNESMLARGLYYTEPIATKRCTHIPRDSGSVFASFYKPILNRFSQAGSHMNFVLAHEY